MLHILPPPKYKICKVFYCTEVNAEPQSQFLISDTADLSVHLQAPKMTLNTSAKTNCNLYKTNLGSTFFWILMLLSKSVVGEVKDGGKAQTPFVSSAVSIQNLVGNNQDKWSHLSLFATSKSEVLKKAKNSSQPIQNRVIYCSATQSKSLAIPRSLLKY